MTAKVITFGAIVLLFACGREPEPAPAAALAAGAPTAADAKDGRGASARHKEDHGAGKGSRGSNKNKRGGKEQAGTGYAVPFVWETSRSDPLAVARGHLKEMLKDNASFVSSKGKPDPAKIAGQARTTIVTCSDAAVRLGAFDATPENDTFVTRNWGNSFEPALGTITYGIEELHTPVLLIVGHTGCEAIKAVMAGTNFSKPIRSQVAKLKASVPSKTAPSKTAPSKSGGEIDHTNQAVLENVNAQVAKAVARFQPLVRTGTLTVIGAVYDATNALGRGQGRLSIVNVNTITDPISMEAFVTAVVNDDKIVQAVASDHARAHNQNANEHATPENAPAAAAAEHQALGNPSPPPSDGRAKAQGSDLPVDIGHSGPAPDGRDPSSALPRTAPNLPAHGLPRIEYLKPSLVENSHVPRGAPNHRTGEGALDGFEDGYAP